MLNGEQNALGFAIGLGRRAEPFIVRRDVVHDARLRGDLYAVADLQVAGDADLPTELRVVADLGAAGDADLRDDDTVLADLDVVADLHEVIDLGTPADGRRAEGATIDGDIGAQLNVVVDDDTADLRNLAVFTLIEHVAETIGANHRAGVKADAVADLAAVINGDPGKQD